MTYSPRVAVPEWVLARLLKGCDSEPVSACPHCEEPISIVRTPDGDLVLVEGLPECDE